MHHCLRIAEIVTMIMNYLIEDGARGAREVLSLMKTCKALYEPSLDILWRDLDCLAPLFMCLSKDVWKIKNKLLVRYLLGLFYHAHLYFVSTFSATRGDQALKNRRDLCFTPNESEALDSSIGELGHSTGSGCDCIAILPPSYYPSY